MAPRRAGPAVCSTRTGRRDTGGSITGIHGDPERGDTSGGSSGAQVAEQRAAAERAAAVQSAEVKVHRRERLPTLLLRRNAAERAASGLNAAEMGGRVSSRAQGC